MTEDRVTYEQHLLALGEDVPERMDCPNPYCTRRGCRPFEIVDVSEDAEIDTDWACSHCLVNALRDRAVVEEAAAAAQLPPWDTPLGLELKAQRNRLLDAWAWALRPDSPLTAECQAAVLDWMKGLQRMTVDFPGPEGLVFTDPPTLLYESP